MQARKDWKGRLGLFPGPRVALIIGGQTKEKVFTQEDAQELARSINDMMKQIPGGSLWITNSRRTPTKSMNALLNELSGYPIYYHDVNSAVASENPYMAYLAMAKYLVVTGDSQSMVSDAVATGKPTYVFAPSVMLEDRHKQLIVSLFDRGAIRFLGKTPVTNYSYTPINSSVEIRDRILRLRSGNCERELN